MMEQHLDNVLNEIVAQPNTLGCLIANSQGLCLGAKGDINPTVAGVATGIAEQACKLEPDLKPPAIILYHGNKRCIIQKDGDITGVIYRENTIQ